jgi:serine/threonine protein kinase
VAPEILCAGVNEGYGTNVDMFSVGVVAYTLLCGYEPFYGVTGPSSHTLSQSVCCGALRCAAVWGFSYAPVCVCVCLCERDVMSHIHIPHPLPLASTNPLQPTQHTTPHHTKTDKQLIAANKLAEYEFHEPEWTRISSEAKDLVSKMLVRDPKKRITPQLALEHPWLRPFSAAAAAATANANATANAAAVVMQQQQGQGQHEQEQARRGPLASSAMGAWGSFVWFGLVWLGCYPTVVVAVASPLSVPSSSKTTHVTFETHHNTHPPPFFPHLSHTHTHTPFPFTDVAEQEQEQDEEEEEDGGRRAESAMPGYEGEAFDYCGGGPHASLLLRLGGSKRRDAGARMRAAADKAERLGGCPLRSQYGSPLCVIM